MGGRTKTYEQKTKTDEQLSEVSPNSTSLMLANIAQRSVRHRRRSRACHRFATIARRFARLSAQRLRNPRAEWHS